MINLLTRTYLSVGYRKTISLQSFLAIYLFSNLFKSFLKLENQRRYLRGRRRINQIRKCWTYLWRPSLQRQNIYKFVLFYLYLLFFSQLLNFLFRLSLQIFHKTFFCTHSRNQKKNDLLVENENEKAFYSLPPSET